MQIQAVEEQAPVSTKKKSAFAVILRFLMWLTLGGAAVLAIMLGILLVYEKEVKSAILTELNKHLKVKVKVEPENIDLTLISTFPNCALRFKNVLVLDALPESKRDTLLYAGDLRLKFNAKDIWNGQYQIHSITADNGTLKLKVLKDGSTNYEFWKQGDTTETTSTAFALDLIELKNFKCIYRDNAARFMADVEIKALRFSGRFGDNNYQLQSTGDLKVNELLQNKTAFLRSKKVLLDIDLAVAGNNYVFKKAGIKINDLALSLSGNMVYSEQLDKADLNIEAKDLQIASALSLLPAEYSALVKDYESKGKLYLSGRYNYSSSKKWKLESKFGLNNTTITYLPNNAVANNVNLKGEFELSSNRSFLRLNNVYLQLKGDEIQGDFALDNFESPQLKVTTKAAFDLANLYEFWPLDTLQSISGRLSIDAAVSGKLEDLKKNTFGEQVQLLLACNISSLQMQFKGDEKVYNILNCELKAVDREVAINNLQLTRGKSDITVSGKLPAFFKYLAEPEAPLIIEGSLSSNALYMEDFLYAGSTTGNSSSQEPLISDKIKLKLAADIKHFEFGSFIAEEVTGDVEVKNQKALINEVQLRCMQGSAVLNAFADNSRGKLEVSLDADIKQINVQELFSQLNNFGQSTLKDENIRGIASASLEFSGNWSNALVVDEKSIEARCKLLIERGSLKKFAPLLVLSKFVEVKDLEDIKFSTLSGDITIKDRKISLPATTLQNSAINVQVWGYHTFDNIVDYHFKLVIGELLNKKRKKNQSEFSIYEEEGDRKYMTYVKMSGNLDNPKVTFDKTGFKLKVAEDIKQEKHSMKRIFREEFGLFKKDSIPPKPAPKAVFELEDEKSLPVKKPLELKKKTEDEDF